VAVLRFPAGIAVGEVWWEDGRAPLRRPREAIGAMEVPDGTAVRLSVGRGHREEPVDLEFIGRLPQDSVFDLNLGNVIPASFAALAHLAPGLRDLSVYIDNLGDDALAIIAELTALESLSLAGHIAPEDGPERRLDDRALSVIADLPALQSLSLLGGSYTEHGLRQLTRLPKLRHLHIERDGLTPSMFQFAVAMPALTELEGLDEYPDNPWTPEAVEQLRAMLPHISVC
jgi:hypothetical protein